MLKQATHIVTMNDRESDKIASFNLQGKILNSFHPIYLKKFNDHDRINYKNDFGFNEHSVILFFGLIRPYKGLDVLINTVNLLKNSIPELKVLVVGESYMSMKQYHLQIEKYNLQDYFIFNNTFVSEDKLKKYFLSSDLVVLPYKKSTQSGVLSLSMNFNIPALVSSNGGLKDYIINNKTGFISSLNPYDLSAIIEKYFNDNLYKSMSENIKNHKKNFNWNKFEESLRLNDN
jgi:glycosyltransferase involved in cell wall biosynthesis